MILQRARPMRARKDPARRYAAERGKFSGNVHWHDSQERGFGMQQGFTQVEPVGPQPAKWRYYSMSFALRQLQEIGTVPHPDFENMTIEDLLDQKGEQGWELVNVAITPQPDLESGAPMIGILYTFKRPF